MKEPKVKKIITEVEFIDRLINGTEVELNRHRDMIKQLMEQKQLLYKIKAIIK